MLRKLTVTESCERTGPFGGGVRDWCKGLPFKLERIPRPALRLSALALLCLAAYWPFLWMPLISDDYIQIDLGRVYGPLDQWANLAQDALYRCRATSILFTHWTEQLTGIGMLQLNLSGLLIHLLNTVLVYCTGYWHRIGWRVSFAGACLFAVQQRPQEAVVWYAALPELLVFTFIVIGLLCWLRYLERLDWRWYAAATAAYLLALLSKESAVVFAPLAAGLGLIERRRPWPAAPFFVIALGYYAAAHLARDQHLHFNDGTFALTAPFLVTAVRSIWGLIWPWGVFAIVALYSCWRWRSFGWIAVAAGWMIIALLPYSFLTYQRTVPSRHTYLASLAVAIFTGKALIELWDQFPHRRRAWTVAAAACVFYHAAYIWVFKYPQYIERARPTERLSRAVRNYSGPVRISCFPYSTEVAQRTVEITSDGHAWLVKDEAVALDFDGCPPARR